MFRFFFLGGCLCVQQTDKVWNIILTVYLKFVFFSSPHNPLWMALHETQMQVLARTGIEKENQEPM